MGLGKFIAGLGAMKHVLKEGSFQTEARENPDKAVDMLVEFNENPKLIEYARHLPKPSENEWLLNTFQYTRQALQIAKKTFPPSYEEKLSKHVMKFAAYLNKSEVFNIVAPHHYVGSAEIQVIALITSCCPEDTKLELLSELEKKGHMQGIVKGRGSSSNADLFFNNIAKNQDKDLAKTVLKLSKSFNIAKQDLDFILYTKQVYPEYLDFITKQLLRQDLALMSAIQQQIYASLGKKRANNVSVYEDSWAISFSGEAHDPVTGIRWGASDIYLLPIRPRDLEETELRAKELEFVLD